MTPRAGWHPWAMLGPSLCILVLFCVVPLVVAGYESLFSWDLLTPARYVGSANYRVLIVHGGLLSIVFRTLAFSAIVVVGTMMLGLALAVLLDRPGRIVALARASVFSAYVVSWVAVALLWTWMLDERSGIVARTLRLFGGRPLSPLGDPRTALPLLAVVAVWKLTGYAMVIFVAGLQSIPRSLHEAAALDGAGAWGRFKHVTVPQLAPTAAFVATTMLATSFQAFDVVRVMTQGGPTKATELLVYAIYEQIFLGLSVGRASALTVVFFVVLLGFAAGQLRVWRVRAGRR
ncbi:MAG: sugar ABC transporter permease [Myxococcota bacterium]|nr:sugar ABC transporter permease [Myxococcota bacterium]